MFTLDYCIFCNCLLTEDGGISINFTEMYCSYCVHNYKYCFYESGHMDTNTEMWLDFTTEDFNIVGTLKDYASFINFSPRSLGAIGEENLVCNLSRKDFEKHFNHYVEMAMTGKLNNYLKKLVILQ